MNNTQPSPKQFDKNRVTSENGLEYSSSENHALNFADQSSHFEAAFQARTATGARLNSWISPLLNHTIEKYHPESQLFGFIHWINQNPHCPWIILSGSLEYGRKAHSPSQEAVLETAIPIRWSIGRYRAGKGGPDAGYLQQLNIAVVFDPGQVPIALQCSQSPTSVTRCSPSPHALSRTLETLYR
ncbi:MAG: hypothetical protein ACLFWD_08870 [Anaerolineales bacterium]